MAEERTRKARVRDEEEVPKRKRKTGTKKVDDTDVNVLQEEGEALIAEKMQTASPSEQQHLEEYVRMLRRTSRIARRLERQILVDKDKPVQQRDVYALSSLYSQIREIIADLRTITDMSAQVAEIVDGPVSMFASSVGQFLLNNYYQQVEIIKTFCPADKVPAALAALKKLTSDTAAAVDTASQQAADRVHDILLAPTNDLPTTKKKRR